MNDDIEEVCKGFVRPRLHLEAEPRHVLSRITATKQSHMAQWVTS